MSILLAMMAVLVSLHGWKWHAQEQTVVTVERSVPPAEYLFRVDMNTATWIEWAQLDGIGEKLARRIVTDREVRGPFRNIDDLDRVRGIGPKTLAKLRPHLMLNEQP